MCCLQCCPGKPALCTAASEKLWKTFLAPVVFYPLATGDTAAVGPDSLEEDSLRCMSVNNWARTWLQSGDGVLLRTALRTKCHSCSELAATLHANCKRLQAKRSLNPISDRYMSRPVSNSSL